MKQIWFKTLLGVLTVTSLGLVVFLSPGQADAYQGMPAQTGVSVTVTYSDPINVRGGPSTLIYPIVGQLNPGDVVPALGVSPGHDWIQISYSGGTGWVYASPVYIAVSPGELQVVEPPPTPLPPPTYTIDPTFAAAFHVQSTPTRMPTFTPPPPLVIPHFTEENTGNAFGRTGIFILGLGLIGIIGLLISYVLRK
ncbi:MAG TPA: SH3 domain-containing protein [Anaerolineales bacterium]|nr:SH3 domain-containing protein [Anaerolineales bacterium]